MPGVNPIDPLLTRALKRAIALCQGALDKDYEYCRNLVKGATPRELRGEIEEYRRLLERIQPRTKRGTP